MLRKIVALVCVLSLLTGMQPVVFAHCELTGRVSVVSNLRDYECTRAQLETKEAKLASDQKLPLCCKAKIQKLKLTGQQRSKGPCYKFSSLRSPQFNIGSSHFHFIAILPPKIVFLAIQVIPDAKAQQISTEEPRIREPSGSPPHLRAPPFSV